MDRRTNCFTYRGGINLIDKDDFCEKIRLYEKAMYSVAYSIVKNEFDAGDIISESIYRAYRNLDTLKNEKAFKSWILRIVHNTAVEMIRKNSNLLLVEEPPEAVSDDPKHEITTKIALRDAVSSLKQPYRTVVVLFYYENLSAARIAEITGTSAITVKKQLSRARKILREILKEDFTNE